MAESQDQGDGPLFIVDNAEGGRNGLEYLREWTEVATGVDIATGYFEIGSLLELDGHWQKLGKIRVLMGDEVTRRTRKLLLDAVRARAAEKLDLSLEADKERDPFLNGADAVLAALAAGQIECRVYSREKFHAKAYITHGKFEVVGSQALVGSSNFTRPGLTRNVELNIKLESSSEVAQLQQWYERHWDEATDITPHLCSVVERHVREYSPFDVYARSLQALVSRRAVTDSAWEQSHSLMFPRLDRYQQEGYWAMVDIARQHGGAFLCDGVGLGKTFVGLTLVERLIQHKRKRVVLLAPKAVRDSVWAPELKRQLPHLGGVGGSGDFSDLTVLSHTDLSRGGDFPDRLARITELADAVVIDEAHHFRNRGRRGNPDDPDDRSRYYRLYDLINSGRSKEVFLLTATPVNNSLNDFRHTVELFSGADDAHFAQTLGVNSVTARLNSITKQLKQQIGDDTEIGEAPAETQDVLAGDSLFQGIVVQRSRAYAQKSQQLEGKGTVTFPKRDVPQVAPYSIAKTYGRLLELIDRSFEKREPLFSLAIYYPLFYYTGSDLNPFEEERQKQVVGLIRTNFLKRFESSIYAFERSCDRLMWKLLAFLEKNSTTTAERGRLKRWQDQNSELLGYTKARQLELWGEEDVEEEVDADVIPPELLDSFETLNRKDFNVAEIIQETFLDLDQIVALLEETSRFDHKKDDKLGVLTKLLKGKALAGQKVLVFTEFADTARYLRKHLDDAGIDGVAQIDSGTKTDRVELIQRFAPYYNGLTGENLESSGLSEIRVLIATDVLSEGLNLQDATKLVNYDIHWNPVRLMQRIGRVDRRLDPEVEERLVADRPGVAKQRGRVTFWNFLPPDDLDRLLRLYKRVSHKTLLISKTLGIEGRALLKPDDQYDPLKDFNAAYEGSTSVGEELHLEYQELLASHPDLEGRLAAMPAGIFAGRELAEPGGPFVFFCYELPALDTETKEFAMSGLTRWYLYETANGKVSEDEAEIAARARSDVNTPRVTEAGQTSLLAARTAIYKHIKNGYLKQIDAPITAPEPRLIGWLELSSA